ncbi:MAG: hypothetical protein ACRD91_05140, partial [Nitrosopumilaceae archaeon]
MVAWQNTEEQPEPQNFLVLPNIDINLSIEFARQYMQYLKDKAYNLEIQSEYKQGFVEIIKSKQITLPELLKLLSDTNVKQNRYKVILKLLGLYIQINDNAAENIFNEILTVLTDLHNRLLAPPILFEQEILHWWRIDDIIAFIVFFSEKFTEPEKTNQFSILTWQVCNSFNVENRLLGASTLTIVNNLSLFPRPSINYKTKDRIASFVLFCLAIYHNTPVGTVRDNLKNFIREINIDFFLRHDFPQKKSFFELYKDIEEFNIELVQKAYQGLKAISKNYAWRTNNYAFQCWSEEGFKDTDFAMPVLSQIGPHLNIVHVFYITLYIQYGGYELRNKMRLADSAIDHIGEIEVKNNSDLKVLFCSEILFLSSINIWKQNREHPELAWTVVENFIDGCGLLIQSSEVNANVKLFTHIMLIELMTIFNFRGYTQFNADETQLKLTVISPSGHVKELMVTGSNMHFMSQENYQKICEELCAEEQRDLACMDRLMNVWDLFIRKLHEESLE